MGTKNIRGRVYTGAIGLGLTIPSLLLLGFGHSFVAVVGAGLLFGIGYGILMLIICLFFVSSFLLNIVQQHMAS